MAGVLMSERQKIWQFIWWQTQLVLGFSLLVLLLKGINSAGSALCGGGVVLTGGAIYVLLLRKITSVKPSVILHLHFAAEIAKLFGMFVVVVILYFWYRQVEWIWVFSGLLVAYSAYWFGLLLKN